MSHIIDLRSDTVTRPTPAMREAMRSAPVGDDVYGEDPTVERLQASAAERLGHEAALFFPSGTQSNLVALLTHCGRGDEYLVGSDAHTYRYEGGGAAVLGGIQPQPVPSNEDGALDLDAAESLVKPRDPHFARTRLLCLENTWHGRVQALDTMAAAAAFARRHDLAVHLDGARVANAAVALDVSLARIGALFDSVSLCLSKGLGAPVGSILCGRAAWIEEARRWRKVVGGGMRQIGVIAAAAELALTDGFGGLARDHRLAGELERALATVLTDRCCGIDVRSGWTQSNMVWLDVDTRHGESLPSVLREHGVHVGSGRGALRLVLHRDIPDDAPSRVAAAFADYLRRAPDH